MRVYSSILRAVQCPVDVVDIHQGVKFLCFFRGQDIRVDTHDFSNGVKPLVLLQSLLVVCNEKSPVVDPAGLYPSLLLQVCEDLVGVGEQLDLCVARTQSPDQTSRVPGGPGCELVLLEEDSVGDPHLGQVVQGLAAETSPSDNNNISLGRN